MLYRKQTVPTPTKNSTAEEASPTRYVVPTVWLQRVVFPSMRGTRLNLETKQARKKNDFHSIILRGTGCRQQCLEVPACHSKLLTDDPKSYGFSHFKLSSNFF